MTQQREDKPESSAISRRSFILKTAALVGTAFASMVIPVRSSAQESARKTKTGAPGSPGKGVGLSGLGRSARLSLRSAPRLKTIPRPRLTGVHEPRTLRPAGTPPPPGFTGTDEPGTLEPVGRKPATRDAMMRAVAGASGGAALLRTMRVLDPTLASSALRTMTRVYTLAEAYANGVTLTPTGCEYSGGMYPGTDPISYSSINGVLWPDYARAGQCYFRQSFNDRLNMFHIYLATPGDDDQRLAYLLELSLTPDPSNVSPDVRFKLNGEEIEFVPTGSGSLLVAVSLTGSSGERRHGLEFWNSGQQRWSRLRFDWLNVVAC